MRRRPNARSKRHWRPTKRNEGHALRHRQASTASSHKRQLHISNNRCPLKIGKPVVFTLKNNQQNRYNPPWNCYDLLHYTPLSLHQKKGNVLMDTNNKISRRNFIKASALTGGALLASTAIPGQAMNLLQTQKGDDKFANDRLLQGVCDIHLHCRPDSRERSVDE